MQNLFCIKFKIYVLKLIKDIVYIYIYARELAYIHKFGFEFFDVIKIQIILIFTEIYMNIYLYILFYNNFKILFYYSVMLFYCSVHQYVNIYFCIIIIVGILIAFIKSQK